MGDLSLASAINCCRLLAGNSHPTSACQLLAVLSRSEQPDTGRPPLSTDRACCRVRKNHASGSPVSLRRLRPSRVHKHSRPLQLAIRVRFHGDSPQLLVDDPAL